MQNPSHTFSGTSSGREATIDEALDNALKSAQEALNVNHFNWQLVSTRGDYGGIGIKNVTVEIQII